jgi:type VI protein secretion system component Hcp
MYLRVSGASGEETDQGYGSTIETFSESWGLSNPPSGTGKPQLSTLSIQAAYDKAEPVLEHDVEFDVLIPTVELTEVNGTAGKVRQVILTNAHLDSLSIGSASGGGSGALSLSFSYQQRQINYYYTDASGVAHRSTSCYNIANNNACTG